MPEASRRTQASRERYARLGVGLKRIETLAQKCQHHDLVGSELGVLAQMAGVLPSCFETLSIAATTLRFASD